MFEQTTDISDLPLARRSLVGVEYKYWINFDGTDFLYKQNDRNELGFFELLCCHLSQKVGFDCVNCYPADDGFGKGVIVESYISPKVVRTISLSDLLENYDFESATQYARMGRGCWFSIDEFIENQKVLEKDNIYLARDLREKFEQMVLVDYLLAQMDRHETNVEFLLTEDKFTGKKILSLAPMYDNGRMLGATRFNFLATPKEISEDMHPQMTIAFHDTKGGKSEIDCVAKTFAQQIKQKRHLSKIYYAFKNLDFMKEVKQVACVCGYDLSQKNLQIIERVYNDRIKHIEKHLQKIDEKQKNKPKIAKKSKINANFDKSQTNIAAIQGEEIIL